MQGCATKGLVVSDAAIDLYHTDLNTAEIIKSTVESGRSLSVKAHDPIWNKNVWISHFEKTKSQILNV